MQSAELRGPWVNLLSKFMRRILDAKEVIMRSALMKGRTRRYGILPGEKAELKRIINEGGIEDKKIRIKKGRVILWGSGIFGRL